MEDQVKVQKKVKELNKKKKKGKWVALNGFHVLTAFSFGKDGKTPTFELTSGVAVKVFGNSTTGELRVFPVKTFVKENG